MKTTKRLLMLVLALVLMMSLAVTVSAEETHDPFLSYRWLTDQDNSWYQQDDWMHDEHSLSHNGYTDGWSTAAGDCVWHVYYLNTWNEAEGKYDATPVHVEVNEYLTLERLKDNDEFGFMPGAKDTDYYYKVTVNSDAWGQPAKVSYTMADGTVLSLNCEVQRYEAGFYTSSVMRDDTWLGGDYYYDRFHQDNHVFYFGFQSQYWTLEKAEFSAWFNADCFTLEDAATIEKVSSSMYKITLKPEFLATGEFVYIDARIFVNDPDGNSNNGDWTAGKGVHHNWDEGAEATIWMDQRYVFAEVDGRTQAFVEVPTGKFNGNGDEICAVEKATLPTGVSYDLSTNTLTLNNCDGNNYLHILQLGYDDGEHLPNENLTIKLIGKNKIACDFMNALTLRGGVKVTITGDGSLHIYADNKDCQDENGNYFDISAVNMDWDTSLTIAGNATVNAQVVGSAKESCWEGDTLLGVRPANISAIRGNNGSLTIKENGSLTTTLPEGVRTNGPSVSDEEMIWGDRNPGGFRGIADMRTIRVEGGTLNTNELILSQIWNEYGQLEDIGTYTQTGGVVNITPIGLNTKVEKWDHENNCPVLDENGNPVMIDHIHYSGLGNHDGGTVTISGGELNISVNAPEEELASSVYSELIFLGRTDQLDAVPTLTISGGTLNLETNAGACISVDGIVNITDGVVNAVSTNDTIYAMKELNIRGGKLSLTHNGQGGCGINANDCDVNISGGEITIDADNPLMVGTWGGEDDYKIDGFNGTLNVTGGKLTLNAGNGHAIAVWPEGKASFTGGETIINGGTHCGGLSLFGPMTIGGNAVITQNEGGWGVFNVRSEEANPGTVTLTIADNAVINLKESAEFTITDYCALVMNGGTLNYSTAFDYIAEDSNNTNSDAMHIDPNASMTVNGGTINASFTNNNARMFVCGDYIQNGGMVTFTGINATAPTADEWNNLVYLDRDSSMTVKGGELNIDAKNYHISLFTNGNVTVEDGTVTIKNDCDGSGLNNYLGYAFAGKGINTINGGTLNLTGDVGLEQSFDPGNSDGWPGVPNTKLTINDGNIHIDAAFEGISVCAPTEINGGTIDIKAAGMLHPNNGRYPGRGISVYPNSSTGSMATYLNINSGFIGLNCGMGNNYLTIGLAAFAPTNINGGTILADATIALYAETDVEGGCLSIHELQNIISLSDGNTKQLLSGSYDFTNPETNETRTWYANSIEEDNTSGDYMELVDQDHCSHVLITTSMCGDQAFWSLNDSVLTITGTGAMWDGFNGWVVADEFINSVKVEEGITQTGIASFADLGYLTSISYPATLTKISDHTAARGTKLTSYTIAEGNQTFTVKDGIAIVNTSAKELVTVAPGYTGDFAIPEGVTSIGSYAFEDCRGLGTVTIPGTVTKLGELVFLNSDAVTVRTNHNSAAEAYAAQLGFPVAYIHEYSDATCTAPATCKYCDATTGSALPHNYADATCTAPKTCKVCGATTGSTLAHNYSSGKCTVCGAADPNYNVSPSNPFKDVQKGAFYYDAVLWAVNKGVTTGLNATTFGPDAPCTRGQIVTFLWRAAGSPAPSSSANPFKDVKNGDFFYEAVLWAVEKGITTGLNATTFGPDAPCTRGQVATFLHRYAGKPAPSGSNPFNDVTEKDFFYEAVLWAVEANVTNGYGNTGGFAPNMECTRGQIVTFLYRAVS